VALILFEKGKKIGEISNWVVTPYVPFYKDVLGKKVLSVPQKDECSFTSPKPINRKAMLTLIEEGRHEFHLEVKSVKGSTHVTAAIVSQKSLSSK
jgi:hypothetical protein